MTLELEEELWSRDRKRLTLFLDPGRIKRGLKPREDLGPVFETGKQYQFRVSGKWKGEDGAVIGEDFVKSFSIEKDDYETPEPKKWKLVSPKANASKPLVVEFDEVLDSALAMRVIEVMHRGKRVEMKSIRLSKYETGISFSPKANWEIGSYQVWIRSELEDLCGNRIGKPFDLDTKQKNKISDSKIYELDFEIK